MKKIGKKESKKVLLDILIYFDKICRENNINYSLIGGSLIGAIRHKGMIPWDDDIDVILLHDEYDKLLSIMNKYNNEKYQFNNYQNNDSYYYPYLKLIDVRTFIEEKYKPIDNYGIYLDIFCYNNLPNNKYIAKVHYLKIMFYKIIISGYATIRFNKNDKLIIIKKIGFLISKIFGIKFILKKYNKLLCKYNKKKTKYLVSNWPCYGLEKEKQLCNNMKKYIYCEFENSKVMISKNYDDILRTTFNDYMKLPPKEKRINHNMKFYWKDNLEEIINEKNN